MEIKQQFGVSGGPDSICLLDILRNLKQEKIFDFEIFVAHINHGLRENAIKDEKYVEEYCKKNNIELYVKHVELKKIAKENKKGLEETGREVRYEFFEEILQKTGSNKIAIAHNKNDNAETVIMNLFRGSGISGLKGIEPVRNKKYIRPIVEIEREQIEQYCEEQNLNPRIDESNLENEYTRNKIRNICIPYIKKEFNPNIINTIERLSTTVREEEEYMLEQTQKVYEQLLIHENQQEIILNAKIFAEQEKVIKRRIVLYTINKLLGNTFGIQKINVEDIVEMCEKNVGNKYIMPNKNIKIMLKNKKIFFEVNNIAI